MLPKWVGWTLGAASVMTVVLAHAGMTQIASYGDWTHEYTTPWSGFVLALAIATVLAGCWLPPARLGRALRVALLLPLVQVAAALAAIAIWRAACAELPGTRDVSPYLRTLPPAYVLAIGGLATFAFGAVIAAGRRGMWLQATAMLSLVQLLFLGLWLPIVIGVHFADSEWSSMPDVVAKVVASRDLALVVLLPPMIAAVLFTTLAIHRDDLMRKHRLAFVYAGATLLLVALSNRFNLNYMSSIMYANFIHVLLALALVAICALTALSASLWLRGRRARKRLANVARAGTIVDDGYGPVARLRIAGWLRGTQIVARPFEVLTDAGPIAVPNGIEIACAPPAQSAQLGTGYELVLLRPGDRVTLAGFEPADKNAPYRGSAGLVPGNDGAWVGTTTPGEGAFAAVALATWRPFVAYLLVAVAIMLPAIAGALAS